MHVLPRHALAHPREQVESHATPRNLGTRDGGRDKPGEREEGDAHHLSSRPGLVQVKREKEREIITPFQPRRADAGAARTSPGRFKKTISENDV